jgi:hypothetical protein
VVHGNTLIYYKDKETFKPQGCVHVQSVQYGKDDCEMSLKTIFKGSEKVYYLKAASPLEREEWFHVFQRAAAGETPKSISQEQLLEHDSDDEEPPSPSATAASPPPLPTGLSAAAWSPSITGLIASSATADGLRANAALLKAVMEMEEMVNGRISLLFFYIYSSLELPSPYCM